MLVELQVRSEGVKEEAYMLGKKMPKVRPSITKKCNLEVRHCGGHWAN